MSYTIEAGTTGSAMTLSCNNYVWVMSSLGLPLNEDWQTEAVLPSEVLGAIERFFGNIAVGGLIDYKHPPTCAKIKEFLVPAIHPVMAVVEEAIGGDGAKVISPADNIDWENLGELSDMRSEACQLWDRLYGYITELRCLARYAQRTGIILRIY